MSSFNQFDIIHRLRMKGAASTEALAGILRAPESDVQDVLGQLAAAGAVREVKSPRGIHYALTDAGLSRHAAELSAARNPETAELLAIVYDRFLALNGGVKKLCAAWQSGAAGDDAARWEAIDGLADLYGKAGPVLAEAGSAEPRFSHYGERLGTAIQRLQDGDERYFTGLLVDSFHNIWFECHEDFIQTLGRHRAQEGSF